MGIAIKALNCDFSSHNIGNLIRLDIIIPSVDLDNTVALTAELDGMIVSANWSISQGESYATINNDGVVTMTKWSDDAVELVVTATNVDGVSGTAVLNISHRWHPTVLTTSDFTFINASNIKMLDEDGILNGIRLAPFKVNNGGGTTYTNYRATGLLSNSKYPSFPYSSSIKPYSDYGVTDISKYILTDSEKILSPIIIPKGCTSLTFNGYITPLYNCSIAIADIYGETASDYWADTGWLSNSFNETINCSNVNEGLDRTNVLCFWINFKRTDDGQILGDEVSSLVNLTLTFNY